MAYEARVESEAAAERALLLFARVRVARKEVDERLQLQRREARAHRARRRGRAGGRAAERPLRAAGAEEAGAGGQRALASGGGAGAERGGRAVALTGRLVLAGGAAGERAVGARIALTARRRAAAGRRAAERLDLNLACISNHNRTSNGIYSALVCNYNYKVLVFVHELVTCNVMSMNMNVVMSSPVRAYSSRLSEVTGGLEKL